MADTYVSFGGYISDTVAKFSAATVDARQALNDTLDDVVGDTSNPAKLAAYQTALSAYTLLTSTVTNVIKADKDMDAGVIANYR